MGGKRRGESSLSDDRGSVITLAFLLLISAIIKAIRSCFQREHREQCECLSDQLALGAHHPPPPTFFGDPIFLKNSFSPKSILVLCEGNHCRSPIAEGLLQAELGPGIMVESAGLGAQDGCAPHPKALQLLAERGIDLGRFRSRQVTPAMALAADLILVMDAEQKKCCEALVPSARGRIYLLGCWLPPGKREIADPFRKDPEAFTHAFDLIQQSISTWKRHLHSSED